MSKFLYHYLALGTKKVIFVFLSPGSKKFFLSRPELYLILHHLGDISYAFRSCLRPLFLKRLCSSVFINPTLN